MNTVLQRSGEQEQKQARASEHRHLHAAATAEPRKPLTFLRVSPGGCSGVEKSIVGILLLAEDKPTLRTAMITLRTTVNNRNHVCHYNTTHTQTRSQTAAVSGLAREHPIPQWPEHVLTISTAFFCVCCSLALYSVNQSPTLPLPLVHQHLAQAGQLLYHAPDEFILKFSFRLSALGCGDKDSPRGCSAPLPRGSGLGG